MKYIYRFTPGIIVVVYILLFIGFKSPERRWDRIINSDGKGYYAYLPAIFIYDDLQFKFIEQYEYQYYPLNKSVFKEFRQDAGDRVVNKYFPGMAILWLPFFLFGHLMAWLEIFPRDGYSLPYQYAIALSAFLFLWLGAKWLMKLLNQFGATDRTAAFITAAITLGTNLIFYVVIEPSMTHVYSFALITGFMYATFNFFHHYQPKWFVRSLLAFTLIFLIRPTNGIILLSVPFLAGSMNIMRDSFNLLVKDKKTLFRGLIQSFILLIIPLVFWYLQTGKPFVYTYGEEKLNFLDPHMLNILFSFNRGWFVYTPIAFIAMVGFIGLFKANKFRFFWLAGFLFVYIYVASCWWVWYYASKCGQRVFVDIYPIVALLMLFLYQMIGKRSWQNALSVAILLLIGLNLVQFYQHAKWIFPPYNITGEIYRDSFFSLSRKAKTYIPTEGITAVKTLKNDMEKDYGSSWMNAVTRNDTVFYAGKWSSKADKKIPYSVGLETTTDSLFTTQNRLIRIAARVYSPKEITEATLVTDFQDRGKSLSYNQFILEDYVPADKWTHIEIAIYVPRNLPETGSVKVYFYNPSPIYKLYVDDLNVDFISLKNEPDYMKIEGVLLPDTW
jgi:hypothetical protein